MRNRFPKLVGRLYWLTVCASLAVLTALVAAGLWLVSSEAFSGAVGLAAGVLATHTLKESRAKRLADADIGRDGLPTILQLGEKIGELKQHTGELELVIAAVVPDTVEMHLPFGHPDLVAQRR